MSTSSVSMLSKGETRHIHISKRSYNQKFLRKNYIDNCKIKYSTFTIGIIMLLIWLRNVRSTRNIKEAKCNRDAKHKQAMQNLHTFFWRNDWIVNNYRATLKRHANGESFADKCFTALYLITQRRGHVRSNKRDYILFQILYTPFIAYFLYTHVSMITFLRQDVYSNSKSKIKFPENSLVSQAIC